MLFLKQIDWLVVSTFFVALVALFIGLAGDWIKSKFKKPKLLVSMQLEPPDCCKIPLSSAADGKLICDCYYFRFKVTNYGNYQMEDVEAMITELYKYNENSRKFEKVNSFLPQNLVWSNMQQIPLQYRITMSKIQPKLFKHLDFGHIISTPQELQSRFNSKVIFIFDVMVQPNNLSHIIVPGNYKIQILFAANNMNVYKKLYLLEIKNNWANTEEGTFGKIVSIKEVTS